MRSNAFLSVQGELLPKATYQSGGGRTHCS
jgi:hypothetical protein